MKSIHALHESAAHQGLSPLLEISSKSPDLLGQSLSALSLTLEHHGKCMSVESAFQGSKVFEEGGPHHDLYDFSGRDARAYPRLRDSGRVIGFRYFELDLPTKPLTAFYDWLYLQALQQNPQLSQPLRGYHGFTDIAFNPAKSLNCQARAAALFAAMPQKTPVEPWREFFEFHEEAMS